MPIYIAGGAGFDKYEEGTWTPVFSTTGAAYPSITYDTQVGTYTRIGDVVHIQGTISTDVVDPGAPSGDLNWNDVELLVKGSEGLEDLSTNDRSITTHGTAPTLSGGYWDFASNGALGASLPNMGASDVFTVEAWINADEWGWVQRIFAGQNWNFGHGTAYAGGSMHTRGPSPYGETGSLGTALNIGSWTHLAITRNSAGLMKVWLGGAQTGSVDRDDVAYNFSNTRFGMSYTWGTEYWNGQMKEWRITLGVCRYTSSFTPESTFTEGTGSGNEASGYLQLGGLPYAASSVASNYSALSVGYAYNWANGRTPITLRIGAASSTKMYLDAMSADGMTVGFGSILTADALATGANSNYLQFAGTYKTSS